MKKLIFMVSLILILALSTVAAFAQDEIIVNINSNKVEFNDGSGYPFIDKNNRTQVPFRATLEKYGATVDWDNDERVALATKGDITVKVPIGEKYIFKNGEKIETDTVALIKDSRTYLPIRAVIEAFGSEVQWDSGLNTVVITTDALDAKKILMDAYAKSYLWKNYNGKVVMDLDISVPDETGSLQTINTVMNMDMTAFTKPQKFKVTANMTASFQGEELNQPVLDMYVTIDESKFNTYMGVYNESGQLTWTKSTIEDKALMDLTNYDMQANLEMTEKFTKDVKYFGKYVDDSGRTLLRIQNTLSGEAYEEFLTTYMEQLATSTNTQDVITSDMFKNLGDFQFILYIDEATGEIVKYEMDLGSIYSTMFANMEPSEEMPQEAIDMLTNLDAVMIMEIFNINTAKDFDIPKEALDAPEVPLIPETEEPVQDEVQ
ncbi:MAG: copper amine oxidase N-terminal domain-containing protein [Tissierellia bacterium]|nr:copper amine oxidase N-terminal domain-containing protein [Tissierellia bacterium]